MTLHRATGTPGQILAGFVVLIGGVGMVGWLLDLSALKSILPGLATMKFNTVVGFIMAGVALWILGSTTTLRHARIVAMGSACGILLLGCLSLGQDLLGWQLGIDELVVRDLGTAAGKAAPGRMSPATAFCFILTGSALLFMGFHRKRIAQWVALTTMTLGAFALIGYLYGFTQLYDLFAFSSMALHTALAFVLLAVGMLSLHPYDGFISVLLEEQSGSILARRLWLPIVVATIVFGGLVEWLERNHLLGNRLDAAVLVAFLLVLVSVVIWLGARSLNRAQERIAYLATIVTSSHDAIISKDLDGIITSWNDGATHIFGYTADEIVGSPITRLLPPDRLGEETFILNRIKQGERVDRFETVRLRKDGQPITVSVTISPINDATGAVVGASKIAHDITEAKKAEQALRKSEAKAGAVLDTTAEGIITIDAEGRIQSFNKAAERLFGYQAGEVIGQKINLLMPSPYYEEHDGYLERYLRFGQPHIIGKGRDVEGQRKDGSVFPMYLSVSEVKLREEHIFTGVVHDLSERAAAEAELHKQARKQAVVAELGQAAWTYHEDMQGFLNRIVKTVATTLEADLCDVLERLPDGNHLRLVAGFGWKENLVGHHLVEAGLETQAGYTLHAEGPILVNDLRTETRFKPSSLLADHEAISGLSVVIQPESGPYGLLEVYTCRNQPFSEDDVHFVQAVANLVGATLQRHQYTEMLEERVRERTAQLEAANRQLESFSYSVSHDLRSPLRAIEGFSRILLDKHGDNLDDKGHDYLQRVRNNTLRMSTLIDDLLQFSRVGRRELKTRMVQPAEIVEQVIDHLMPLHTGRSIDFAISDLPPCKADPALLQQVYTNLIGNALKFTKKREHARIEIGAVPVGKMVRYHIADNGTGFDMQYADKLFGVFQRLHRQEEYEGTGVGLAIVHRIIHRHGGEIWAKAEPNNGATFYFTLPTLTLP